MFKARKSPAETEPDRGATAVEDTPPPTSTDEQSRRADQEPAPAASEPATAERADAEPAKAEPVKQEPAKQEPAKASAPVAEKKPPPRQREERKDRQTGKKVVAGVNAVRSRIASLIWLVAVVCALFLAIGALLVALKANKHNGVVSFVLGGADKLDLGVFSRKDGIFTFHGKDAAIKDALVNWGIGAIVYLVVGKLVDRFIRP